MKDAVEVSTLKRWLTESHDQASEAAAWAELTDREKEMLAFLRQWRRDELEHIRQLEDTATQLEAYADFSDQGFWTLPYDAQNPLNPEIEMSFSPSCLRLLGFHPTQEVPDDLGFWLNQIHPDDAEEVQAKILDYTREAVSKDALVLKFRLRHMDQTWHWMRIQGKFLLRQGHPPRLGGIIKDITEELRTQKALADQLIFQHELLQTLPNPVFVKNAQAQFLFFNHAYEKFFGIRTEEYIGKTVMELDFLPLADRQHYQREDEGLIAYGGTVHREVDFLFADGSVHHSLYWSSGFQSTEGEVRGLIGIIVDISEQKKNEQELAQKIHELNLAKAHIENISRTDDLTGLANRRAFMETFQIALSQADRHNHPLSLLMADLDHFKRINDTLGHSVGDAVLRDFAALLRQTCRKEDLPARSGGEEFLVLLPMTNLEDALKLANRICSLTRELSSKCPPITVSLGVVQYIPGEMPDALLQRVDQALYQAKRNGRDCVCTTQHEKQL